jgi:TPP-dependent pyruvate/acetoin dehydrogenase alpha subunit
MLFAELMGRATGVCGGRGGSQHLHWRNFYSNGVQGGIIPLATGMALGEKFKQTGAIVVVFLGDGTLGEGVLYESLNMASLWGAPVLYVLENNRIAQTTPVEIAVAGGIMARFEAFGIQGVELSTSDVHQVSLAARELMDQVRGTLQPRALVLHTFRFGPHSKGDDTRDVSLVQGWRERHDPLRILAERIPPDMMNEVEAAIDAQIMEAYQAALADPYPDASSIQVVVGQDEGGKP